MGRGLLPRSCFGLYFSEEEDECKQCSLKSICREVTYGKLSWGIVAAYIAQYIPQNKEEESERNLLLVHINEQMTKLGRKYVKRLLKEESKKLEVEFLDPDPANTLASAINHYKLDLSYLHDSDWEVLKKIIQLVYPLPLTKISEGGGVGISENKNKYKKMNIHLSFAHGRLIVRYTPASRNISIAYTISGLKGIHNVYGGKVSVEAYNSLEKIKDEVMSRQSKVVLLGDGLDNEG